MHSIAVLTIHKDDIHGSSGLTVCKAGNLTGLDNAVLFPWLCPSISDETRTSYLLQGVQSAWDSLGQRKPQNQVEHKSPSSVANEGGADFAAAASSSSLKIQEDQVPTELEVMGAEAVVCVPHKGNNVSSQII